jgi:hypothetical protein
VIRVSASSSPVPLYRPLYEELRADREPASHPARGVLQAAAAMLVGLSMKLTSFGLWSMRG